MNYKEACEWLEGKRSMTNIILQDPISTWQVRIAEADAAMTQQAYWIFKAHTIPVQSSDLLCRDCFYWDKGTCRRYPPQNKWMRQPGMDPKDWCGEHKPKGGGIMKNKPVGRNPHGKSGPHKIGNAELPPKKQISNTPPLKKRRET